MKGSISLSEADVMVEGKDSVQQSAEDRTGLGDFLRAVTFAARKHQDQRRKGRRRLPYINHPLRVAEILWEVGGVRDPEILMAAVLHDTLEDTETTPVELGHAFGARVLSLVQEVTDDKSLPKAVRKQLQIDHTRHLSCGAKMIKLADKIHNVYELTHEPPADWPRARVIDYVDWAGRVVAGLRGANAALEAAYDEVADQARRTLSTAGNPG
jgi:(p)ppGpp synthase/HD superfamily hydrolase